MSMIGTRHRCQCCNRVATITEEYADGPYDNGYYYVFDGEPTTRWISTDCAAVRFRRIYQDDYPTISIRSET